MFLRARQTGCRRDADGQDAGGTRMIRMPAGRGDDQDAAGRGWYMPVGRGWSGCRRDADGQDAGGTRMVRMPAGRGWSGCRRDADGQDAGGTRMVRMPAGRRRSKS